jgi:hypothetical protein
MNFEKQSVLARLLACENITVQHGAYRTAFFDVERRVLGLPIWKDKGKDVYDLLVGHEVGHALFTPSQGWHDSQHDVDGIPRSYLNVIEDIRIERMIQAKYPGLVASFKRGYSILDKDNFFGVSNKDVNTLGLMDRINLKAKLRDLIEVSFSSAEQPYVDAAFKATTWSDVVEAARALYNFLKDAKNDATNTQMQDSDDTDMLDAGETDGNGGVSASPDAMADDGEEESAENGNSFDQAESDSDKDSDKTEDASDKGLLKPEDPKTETRDKDKSDVASSTSNQDRPDPVSSDDIEKVMTDDNFRNRESDLIHADNHGYMPTMVSKVTRPMLKKMITSTKELFVLRDAQRASLEASIPSISQDYNWDALESEFEKFNGDTKKYVNVMAKEFEMRKAAYQTIRAQTSRSGSLNVDKLYNYKFTDDIFKRVTNLADAKSHGMIMIIDYSGSMNEVISDVIRQTLILTSFCKKINIPFDVYSFTSGTNGKDRLHMYDGQPEINDVVINQLISSSLTKNEYNRAYKDLFAQSYEAVSYRIPVLHSAKCEDMGSTPLNETLMAIEILADDFKAKHNLQKTAVVTLSDGAASNILVNRDYDLSREPTSNRMYRIQMQNEMVSVQNRYSITTELLKVLSKKHTMIGYYLAARSYDFRGAVWDAADGIVSDTAMSSYRRDYNKNKFVGFNKPKNGYDKYFIIKAENKSLAIDDNEFSVSDNANKGEIQRAFKKFAGSKKTNRVFATQFAQMLA